MRASTTKARPSRTSSPKPSQTKPRHACLLLADHNAGRQALLYLVLKDASAPAPTAAEFRESVEYAKDVLRLRDTYENEGSLR